MKKFTSFMFVMVLALSGLSLNAQTNNREVVYADDFESYTVGAYVAQVIPDYWTTWSNAPGTAEDAVISNEQASSGAKSIIVAGTNDMVLKLGNKTSGKYVVSWNMFIPVGFAGYYNFQHFEAPGNEWAFEVYFDNNGTGYMHAGGNNAATFTYTNGEWLSVTNLIDLDEDWAEVYFNDALIYEWQFSLQAQGETGTKQLGGVNFYAGSTAGMTPTYYVDDVSYEAMTEDFLFYDEFDTYTADTYVAVTIPEFFTTWSNAPGTAEDAKFSTDFAETAPNSVKVDGTTDLVFKLGNKTSGKYIVAWDWYIPTGLAGYYNFQHFEAPGNEWAFEVYFDNNGTGYMHAGGNNAATFTYTNGEWMSILNVIDLDADWAQVYFDDVLIYEWQYSLQAQGEPGAKQLGGVNFYAGSTAGMTPTYYFDNAAYAALIPGAQDPTIQISASPIIVTIQEGNVDVRTLAVGNTGEALLNVDVVTSFDLPTASSAPSNLIPAGTTGKVRGEFVVDPSSVPGEAAPSNRDVTLNYDGENTSGVGFTNAVQWRASARFPASMVNQYNGMYLSSVLIYINDPANSHKLQIYDMGSINLPGPGALLYEQPFDGLPGWNTITLANPVYISGRDIWIGYWMDQPAGIFPAGTDAGPAHPDGRWVSSGPGWGFLTLDYNWNIRGILTGTAGTVWLSATPNQMTIEPGQTSDLTVDIDASGLQPLTIYKGKLHVRSNDLSNEQVNISVWITVLVGVNETGEQTYVSLYPNPANDFLILKANTQINLVTITNNLGQVVYTGEVKNMDAKIDISTYNAGMYFVRIETVSGTATQKLMIE
ncbi:MAG: hypothetical protein CVT92_10120 [Bacteroidetes bacterium HGW-Bacteroidetes-1]|jgi:hypothetical protein|nr:MAG: hypothetical protein CVT92_10120 [Bacteroidetes bacterium HGW-Bacteroidetes-1]